MRWHPGYGRTGNESWAPKTFGCRPQNVNRWTLVDCTWFKLQKMKLKPWKLGFDGQKCALAIQKRDSQPKYRDWTINMLSLIIEVWPPQQSGLYLLQSKPSDGRSWSRGKWSPPRPFLLPIWIKGDQYFLAGDVKYLFMWSSGLLSPCKIWSGWTHGSKYYFKDHQDHVNLKLFRR